MLSGTESNVNLYERFDSPANSQRVIVIVKDTAVITTLLTGVWPAGSHLTLYNYGYILGAGGEGGHGGGVGWPTAADLAGEPGGSALELGMDLTLNMFSGQGYLWGGGGGGGGGYWTTVSQAMIGGGGGGGGVSGGLGGEGGFATGGGGQSPDGEDATSGINAVPGVGGDPAPYYAGGNGGSWASSGFPGEGNGGAGGNGGRAIDVNGYSWEWGPSVVPGELYGNGQVIGVIN